VRLVRIRTISAHPCGVFGRLILLGPKGPGKSLNFAIPSEQKRPFLKEVGCKWPPSEPFSQISSILCPNISHSLLDQPHPLYSGVLTDTAVVRWQGSREAVITPPVESQQLLTSPLLSPRSSRLDEQSSIMHVMSDVDPFKSHPFNHCESPTTKTVQW
jgi:hypothetical protein